MQWRSRRTPRRSSNPPRPCTSKCSAGLKRTTGQRPFPDGAERHDVPHAISLPAFEGLFPAGGRATALADSFRGSGFADGSSLRIDAERRDNKQPDATAFAIDPPGDVAVSLRPDGGFTTARAFLRGYGEGQHFAHAEPGRPFEDRLFGGRILPAAFGVLFQNVLLEKKWLKGTLGSEPADLRRVIALAELFRLRHAAAVFLCSLQMDREGLGANRTEQFTERLSHALGARWPAGLCLWECMPALDAGTTLAAAAFEASFITLVRDKCDEDWWANPRLGPFLTTISGQGQLRSARAVAESLGMGAVLVATAKRLQSAL